MEFYFGGKVGGSRLTTRWAKPVKPVDSPGVTVPKPGKPVENAWNSGGKTSPCPCIMAEIRVRSRVENLGKGCFGLLCAPGPGAGSRPTPYPSASRHPPGIAMLRPKPGPGHLLRATPGPAQTRFGRCRTAWPPPVCCGKVGLQGWASEPGSGLNRRRSPIARRSSRAVARPGIRRRPNGLIRIIACYLNMMCLGNLREPPWAL